MRPKELAGDETGHLEVLQHAVRALERKGDRYDAVMVLQPTSPLRGASDIDGSIELLESSNVDSVVSLVHVGGTHPYKTKIVTADGFVDDPPFAVGMSHVPRQALPDFFHLDGSIYLTRRDVLMGQGLILGRRTLPWIIDASRSVNIDTPLDLLVANQLLAKRRCEGAGRG